MRIFNHYRLYNLNNLTAPGFTFSPKNGSEKRDVLGPFRIKLGDGTNILNSSRHTVYAY